MKMLVQLFIRDDGGAVVSIELLILSTLMLAGLIAGLTTYRDAVVQELGDSAAGVASLQQSYTFDAIQLTGSYGEIPYDSTVGGSSYVDTIDFCEAIVDAAGAAPLCIEIDATSIENEL